MAVHSINRQLNTFSLWRGQENVWIMSKKLAATVGVIALLIIGSVILAVPQFSSPKSSSPGFLYSVGSSSNDLKPNITFENASATSTNLTIAQTLSHNASFSKLVSLLKSASATTPGYFQASSNETAYDILNGSGNFTLFAPDQCNFCSRRQLYAVAAAKQHNSPTNRALSHCWAHAAG